MEDSGLSQATPIVELDRVAGRRGHEVPCPGTRGERSVDEQPARTRRRRGDAGHETVGGVAGAGWPQATDVTRPRLGTGRSCWPGPSCRVTVVRSPVHTAGAPVAVPMATQVVEVQESPVTVGPPSGTSTRWSRCSAPDPAIGPVMTVASERLAWSPIAVASQSVAAGQAMVPTDGDGRRQDVRGDGRDPGGLTARRGGVAVEPEDARVCRWCSCRSARRWWRSDRRWSSSRRR